MESSVTSETISQQTICGDNKGLDAVMETNKEQIKFEQKKNQLSKAREIYFKYFSSQKMARTKGTVRKWSIMGLPLVSSIRGRHPKMVKVKSHKLGSRGLKRWSQRWEEHQLAGDNISWEHKPYKKSADSKNPWSCYSPRCHSYDSWEKFCRGNTGTTIFRLEWCWHYMKPLSPTLYAS